MAAIFFDVLGNNIEVFMGDFSLFENYFDGFLAHLTKILEVCVKK